MFPQFVKDGVNTVIMCLCWKGLGNGGLFSTVTHNVLVFTYILQTLRHILLYLRFKQGQQLAEVQHLFSH